MKNLKPKVIFVVLVLVMNSCQYDPVPTSISLRPIELISAGVLVSVIFSLALPWIVEKIKIFFKSRNHE